MGNLELGLFFWFAVLVNAVLSGIVGYAAKQRGRRPYHFFWLSFLASFLVGILVLLALPQLGHQSPINRENCPQCDELVSTKARICPHCKSEVAETFAAIQLRKREEAARATEFFAADEAKRLADQSAARSTSVEARRRVLSRLVRSPVSWTTALVVTSLVTFGVLTSLQNTRAVAEEEVRVQSLVRPNCTISSNSVNFDFQESVTVKVSLPVGCVENLRQALDEGLISEATDLGHLKLDVSLDGRKVRDAILEVTTDFTSEFELKIPNRLFYEFAHDRKMAAKSIKVQTHYESPLQVGLATIVESDIPLREPSIASDLMILGKSFDWKVATVKYTSYQIADTIEFDWPLDSNDMTVSGHDFSRFNTEQTSAIRSGFVGMSGFYWEWETPLEEGKSYSLKITAIAGSSEPVVMELPVGE